MPRPERWLIQMVCPENPFVNPSANATAGTILAATSLETGTMGTITLEDNRHEHGALVGAGGWWYSWALA